jgi:hypothetical protein
MPSSALNVLMARLADVDELIVAHAQVGGTGPGFRSGVASLNRAGIVLSVAALEGYVEALFEECLTVLVRAPADTMDGLRGITVARFHNPNVDNVRQLFRHLGITNIWDGISWRNCSNRFVRARLDLLVRQRHEIAHGQGPVVHLSEVREARSLVERIGQRLDAKAALAAAVLTGQPRPW